MRSGLGEVQIPIKKQQNRLLACAMIEAVPGEQGKGTKWDSGQNPVTASVQMDAAIQVWS